MQKKIWVIILTVLVFLSGSVLGFANVFRVADVTVQVSAISSAAEGEANELRAQLKKAYIKENIFFTDDEAAKQLVEAFPHFHITAFKKDYPNRIVLSVSEDAEVYSVQLGEGKYLILGEDGTVLAERSAPTNRLDGEANVLLSGIVVRGEKGQIADGGESLRTLLTFCNRMAEKLNGIRDNILTVEVSEYAPQYRITTREGVKLYVGDPQTLTEKKADTLADKYLSLLDEERLTGRIIVSDLNGQIVVGYENEDLKN